MTDKITSRPSSDAYRNGYDAIFGKKHKPRRWNAVEVLINSETPYSILTTRVSDYVRYEQAPANPKGGAG